MAGPARSAIPTDARRRIIPRLRRLLTIARWAVPLLLLAAVGGGIVLSRIPQGQAVADAITSRALAASAALGFAVSDIEVEGRKTTRAATILAALGAQRGTPIFAVDPERARRRLERLPWVRSATIERRLPGTLFVRLVEREPLAVWQHDGHQELIDRSGEVIAVKDLSPFSRLPTVVGADAPQHAAALLAMLAKEPQLARRVTAAVRVDNRRWNVRIDHRIDVLLPEEAAAAAWAKLAEIERTTRLLQRDVEVVDLRLADRLVVRVASPPAPTKNATPAKTAATGSRI